METELTIQQVAMLTGLSVHTLRYYERNGLLEPVNRAANGHRRYSATDITRIKFLTRLRATGMPIQKMQQFASLYRQKPEAVAERRAILEAHEQAVTERIRELSQNLEAIQQKILHYQELEARNQNDNAFVRLQDEQLNCLAKERFSFGKTKLTASLAEPVHSEAEAVEPEQLQEAINTHNSLNGSIHLKH